MTTLMDELSTTLGILLGPMQFDMQVVSIEVDSIGNVLCARIEDVINKHAITIQKHFILFIEYFLIYIMCDNFHIEFSK
jgi:hypothetical protein